MPPSLPFPAIDDLALLLEIDLLSGNKMAFQQRLKGILGQAGDQRNCAKHADIKASFTRAVR